MTFPGFGFGHSIHLIQVLFGNVEIGVHIPQGGRHIGFGNTQAFAGLGIFQGMGFPVCARLAR